MRLDTRIINLIKELENSGWKSENPDFKLEWWADTVIKFNSIWSPTSSFFYLTTLVDPQSSKFAERKQGENIWAITISNEFPINENTVQKYYALSELKVETIEIITRVESIRNQ